MKTSASLSEWCTVGPTRQGRAGAPGRGMGSRGLPNQGLDFDDEARPRDRQTRPRDRQRVLECTVGIASGALEMV